VAALVAGPAGTAWAAAPHVSTAQVDTTFGQNGVTTIPYLNGGSATTLAVQPDGKFIVGGAADTTSPSSQSGGNAAVSRLANNGSIDTTFGTSGVATLPIDGETASVAVAPDGGILALAIGLQTTTANGSSTTTEETHLVRLTSGGSLDTSFGTGGQVLLGAQPLTGAAGLAVLADGDIYASVAQESSPSSAPTGTVFRFLSNGTADSAFGSSGSVALGFAAVATAAGPGGGVLVGGAKLSAAGIPTGQLEELNQAGSPASGFGTAGVAAVSPGAPAIVSGLAVDGSGRIDLTADPLSADNDLGRLTATGSPDDSFGRAGFASLSSPLLDLIGDGSLAVVTSTAASGDLVVGAVDDLGIVTARFLDSGAPDVAYGVDGVATSPWPEGGPPLTSGQMGLQADGSAVVSGTGPGGSAGSIAEAGYVTRFKPTGTGSTSQSNQFGRLAGTTRVDTAVRASGALFPTAPTGGAASFSGVSSSGQPYAGGVVLASSLSYPDALVGVPLAVSSKGPLLLTSGTSLEAEVTNEINRVLGGGSSGAIIDVLGGTAVISDQIVGQLTSAGYTVHRYAGADRYATSVDVATNALADPPVVLEATGTDFADAASAGAAAAHIGAAVLLTNGSTMPSETAAYISAHSDDLRYAVGEPAAQADPSAHPVVGADRYATSEAVAQTFFVTPDFAGLATGLNYPDALSGGVYSALSGGPLLLTDPNQLSAPTSQWLGSEAPWVAGGEVVGGSSAVSQSVQTAAGRAIT
jgi:uncharacterized delta-60 repeat protein